MGNLEGLKENIEDMLACTVLEHSNRFHALIL
jgi:hypothetical protein